MPAELSPRARLAVAIVAPSLAILGGQAVQARRLLDAWANRPRDCGVSRAGQSRAARWLRPLTRVKYVRTVVTQLIYLPMLVRELRRADVVHVFSASYWSFLLAPLPAVIVARLLGRPVLMNYRSGEAPDHLRRSAIARTTLRAVDRNVVPSRFLQSVFAEHGIPARDHPEHHRPGAVSLPAARTRCGRDCSPRATSKPLYDVDMHAARVCRDPAAAIPTRR